MKKALSLALGLLLTAAMSGCTVGIGGASRYPDAEKYSVGDFTFSAADVDKIAISWASGEVRLERSASGECSVAEDAPAGLPEDARMHWFLDGRTLRIQFCASGYSGAIRGVKRLRVQAPDGVALNAGVTSGEIILDAHAFTAVSLGCTSGGVAIGSLSADTLDLGVTSGTVFAGALDVAGEINAGATSGSLTLESVRAASVQIGATSGSVSLGLSACGSADIAATSGNISLALLDGLGATLEFATVSGSLGGKSGNARLVLGDGSCAVTAATTSGDCAVEAR